MAIAAVELAKPSRSASTPRGWRPKSPADFPTLGWGVLAWTYAFLPSPANEKEPFVYTDEQALRVLRIYELDPLTGTRLYRRVHEEEAKGWGKGPFAASIGLAEFCGPVRFDGWDAEGQPVGAPWGSVGRPPAWVQIAAVSEDQTNNTYNSLYGFLTGNDHRAAIDLRIDEGRTRLYLRDMPAAFLERVTASAASREGQPVTHVVCDEPQLWTPSNGGDLLARTVNRNVAKTNGWAHYTGNAPVLGEESVAETLGNPSPGVLHFARRPSETPKPDWPREKLRHALDEVYGDASWIDRDRILADATDPANPWSEVLRFFFNTRIDIRPDLGWIPKAVWEECAGDVVMQPTLETRVVVTIGHDHRSAAVATAQRQGDQVAVRVRHFPDRELPPGDYQPVAELEEHVLRLRARYAATVQVPVRFHPKGREAMRPRPGPDVIYHGSFFEGSAQRLRAKGMSMRDVPDTQEKLAPAAETLRGLVIEGRLVHDGDPALAYQMGQVLAREVAKGWTMQHAGPAARAVVVAAHAAMSAAAVSRSISRVAPR